MLVPAERIRTIGRESPRAEGEYVLYWMIANRRTSWNYGLDRAIEHARELDRPLVVLEALRCGYRWASDRLHAFVLEGMRDNRRAFDEAGITYLPYLEPEDGAGKGLLEALAKRAAIVVTDDFPCFFLPKMVAAAAEKIDVALESVDSNGLTPIREPVKAFPTAYAFRRYYQKNLAGWFGLAPEAEPLVDHGLPKTGPDLGEIEKRWPMLDGNALRSPRGLLDELPIDHEVEAVATQGGEQAGRAALENFVENALPRYGEDRNQPDEQVTSGLSPYLHFGHVSAHEIFAALVEDTGFSLSNLAVDMRGKRAGWWGLDEGREGFLDQLVTWRELCYRSAAHLPGYDRYESLSDWAQLTLAEHEDDGREHLYGLDELERAETHDEIWNAAQREIMRTGRMHNYLRMLWGKKIIEWSVDPRAALDAMVHLNNKFGLDGRNPNSYGGIFWVLGRYDRPWGPERPIFGKIRYMSSDNTRRKVRLKEYLQRYAAASQGDLFGD